MENIGHIFGFNASGTNAGDAVFWDQTEKTWNETDFSQCTQTEPGGEHSVEAE